MTGTASRMLQSSLVRWCVCIAGTAAILVPLCAPLWAEGEDASADRRVIDRITAGELKRILGEEGYLGVEINDANGIGTIRMDGTRVRVIISDDKHGISMLAAWSGTETSLSQVNDWNRTRKYSTAFTDKDGDPVIEFDLDLTGGVTIARVKDYIKTVKTSISIFQIEVLIKRK